MKNRWSCHQQQGAKLRSWLRWQETKPQNRGKILSFPSWHAEGRLRAQILSEEMSVANNERFHWTRNYHASVSALRVRLDWKPLIWSGFVAGPVPNSPRCARHAACCSSGADRCCKTADACRGSDSPRPHLTHIHSSNHPAPNKPPEIQLLPSEVQENLHLRKTNGRRKQFHGVSIEVRNALIARQTAVHLRLGEPAHLAVQVCVTTPQITQRAVSDGDRQPRRPCGGFQKLHMSTVRKAAGEIWFSGFGPPALCPAVHD